MKTIILKDIVKNAGSNDQGVILFQYLNEAISNGEQIVLSVDSDLSISSSFLNSSIGLFIDKFGIRKFKQMVKFKGSRNQFSRISTYVDNYAKLYSL